jgi:hypothetical protein
MVSKGMMKSEKCMCLFLRVRGGKGWKRARGEKAVSHLP